jgi:type IV pilus assembly protein PilB
VFVGEMRDKITAETAIKLANTGHLVFSTLHTNDAPSAVARLYKMGIEPFLIAYAINIIVAQRLIRTLCKVCKQQIDDEEKSDLLKFGFTEEDIVQYTFYKPGGGCEKCNAGWKGRAAIHEALFFSKAIKDIILNAGEKVDENAIRDQASKDGMWTLRRSGMERMKEGITALEEVIASTVEED